MGVPPFPCKVQPLKLMLVEPGLYSSIHSSVSSLAVPIQAISLMTTLKGKIAS